MAISRRDMLRATVGASALMALGPTVPDWLVRSARAAASRRDGRDTVLVVVQLSGGNDGLNTVVPYADDHYARNRPTLSLPTGELHKIDSQLAFHPRMGAFMQLYRDGHLCIVQGVGSPNADQSHEGAMRIWHTADPQHPGRQTGWLGRAADQAWSPTEADTTAVFVGPIHRPFALNAEKVVVPAIRAADDLTLRRWTGRTPSAPMWTHGGANTDSETDEPLLAFLRRSAAVALTKSRRMEAAAGTADYPPFGLARDLRTVAQLVRADVGIRIFFTELGGGGIGGFDNHANQLGNHCALLHQLAESVAAFVADLKRDNLLDRVILMTFSEFGRTVKENGRRGTGHGAAAPVFLVGGRLKQRLVGRHPSLTDLDGGALKYHTDFRRVYATVLDRWLGFDSEPVLGSRFDPLDILAVT